MSGGGVGGEYHQFGCKLLFARIGSIATWETRHTESVESRLMLKVVQSKNGPNVILHKTIHCVKMLQLSVTSEPSMS